MPSNPSKGWMNIMTNRSNIPITRRRVASEKADAIRAAVSGATAITTENASSRVATVEDAAAFHEFLSDPQIHAPIYTLPRPLTVETVRDFIADHQGQREHGTGLLFLNFDEQGAIGGWMFQFLGLDLICETASLDNHRTAHLLDGLGFRRMGKIISQRADGTTRPSLVWEVSRAEWERDADGS